MHTLVQPHTHRGGSDAESDTPDIQYSLRIRLNRFPGTGSVREIKPFSTDMIVIVVTDILKGIRFI
jgi:hypothetical protein